MHVVLTQEAVADLAEIRATINQDNPTAALRVATQLMTTCDRLGQFPERGRIGLVEGTRELVAFWPYVIVYRITPPSVFIIRILHGARDRA